MIGYLSTVHKLPEVIAHGFDLPLRHGHLLKDNPRGAEGTGCKHRAHINDVYQIDPRYPHPPIPHPIPQSPKAWKGGEAGVGRGGREGHVRLGEVGYKRGGGTRDVSFTYH